MLGDYKIRINIKPLSVNEAWQGRRKKTDSYRAYEKEVLYKLRKMDIPSGNLYLRLEFGFSSAGSDFDNPIKPIVDIFQKYYGFNDNRITKAYVEKKKVSKGEEYIEFSIDSAANYINKG